ncbi:hypothetical protein RI129_001223 [Pyrocoelia pectoralis]|uniref:DUF7869 domain-containing protein n=1 Tax=Pyrocoelia pectoralis TaxID=417401 RepID=A0AAN7VXH3_9COLE
MDEDRNKLPCASKKRGKYGRVSDVSKKLKLQTHETGASCECTRFKCFQNIAVEERAAIIKHFNSLKTHDEQNLYLGGLITHNFVKRHRSRQVNDEDVQYHSFSYSYRVRVERNTSAVEVPICYKAMLALHGISAKRIQNIQLQLVTVGHVEPDKPGRHSNHRHKLKEDTKHAVYEHIKSFKGRKAHYSLRDSERIYLPEELNVKRMHRMFMEDYPNKQISYETYRTIFVTEFNISFGYPRTDTCSSCDEYKAQKSILEKGPFQKDALSRLDRDHQLHLLKANAFYKRKRTARLQSQKNIKMEAIAMDFQKNLPIPNISTNDVYYKRQLSFYSFNIHVLSSGDSLFYTYTETAGKKGSDEVASMLFDFIFNHLDNAVEELEIFCDSCCGQNKNYTLFRLIHFVVHTTKRLKNIKMTFPVRGHSYMECDRNMGLINQKACVELPCGWNEQITSTRVKPSPFQVISCEDQGPFRSWTTFLAQLFLKKCPFESRPIKELTDL